MKKALILILLISSISLPYHSDGQEVREIKKIKLSQNPISFSVDTEENIYLGFENGTMSKFSPKGDAMPSFSLPNQSSITLIEAQNNRKLFFFQRDIQQFTILDRFSAQPRQYQLSDFQLDFVSSACPAPDGAVWVIENNPSRLKKIDMLRKSVVHEVQYNFGDSVFFMKTINNLLLIVDEEGLLVFDQFGNFLSSLPIRTRYIQVVENEVIASHDGGFVRIDPYAPEILEKVKLPVNEIKSVIKLKQKYVVIHSKSLSFVALTKTEKK